MTSERVFREPMEQQNEADQIDACWKRIGIWSPEGASCSELKELVHCRNCPKFTEAGSYFLAQQSLPTEQELRLREREYEQTSLFVETAPYKATLFRIGAEWLLLGAEFVVSVLDPKPYCWIPHRSGGCVCGIANVDGDALVVLSLQRLLGIDSQVKATARQRVYPRMLVVGSRTRKLLVSVDEVFGQVSYGSPQIKPVPGTVGKALETYSRGLLETEGKRAGLLDGGLLLYGLEQAMK